MRLPQAPSRYRSWATLLAVTLTCALLGPLGHASGQGRTLRVGLIGFSSEELRESYEQSLIEGLRERGYVEGKNLTLVRRYANGRPSRVPQIANELANLNLDAVVTTCTPTTAAMHRATQTTPLVMAAVSDPVGEGLIKSYARPGGNITGLATEFEDVVGKMLQLLLEAVPSASPVAVLFDAENPVHREFLKELESAAGRLGVHLLPMAIGVHTNLRSAFDTLAQRGAVSVLVLPDDTLVDHRRRPIIAAAARHHMPSFFGYREAIEDGGLMSYGESLRRIYRRAAYYLDKIAKGIKPAQLPVEQPIVFELVINLKTAKTLDLTIPSSLLARADQVIE